MEPDVTAPQTGHQARSRECHQNCASCFERMRESFYSLQHGQRGRASPRAHEYGLHRRRTPLPALAAPTATRRRAPLRSDARSRPCVCSLAYVHLL
eukprot:6206556-Pleurochrysis_carterae.AAC.3